jgi:hypothetical protein
MPHRVRGVHLPGAQPFAHWTCVPLSIIFVGFLTMEFLGSIGTKNAKLLKHLFIYSQFFIFVQVCSTISASRTPSSSNGLTSSKNTPAPNSWAD